MPVIVVASPKGGPGKTTTAVVLATQLALKGASVTVIDADPNGHVVKWKDKEDKGTPEAPKHDPRYPKTLTVISATSELSITEIIRSEAERSTFVIVDLEGTASLAMGQAMTEADLMIVPVQGSHLDGAEGAKAVILIKGQEKSLRRKIPHAVLFTRTNAAIRPRTLQSVREMFTAKGTPVFRTQMHERDAFKAIFSFGGTLESLDPAEVSNKDAAIRNALEVTGEVVSMLRDNKAEDDDVLDDSLLTEEVA